MSSGAPFILAAGGTGGHMVPAHCLALALRARGERVHLVTDARGLRFPGLFDGVERTLVEAGSTGRSGLASAPAVGLAVARGTLTARRLFKAMRPAAVVGFGGYPSLPSLLGAFSSGVPAVIHEQNAVLGRVNRLAAPRVKAIATSYPQVRRLEARFAGKTILTGNPVRPEVLSARDVPFIADAPRLKLLVTGGSQGAAILNTVVPAALALLPPDLRDRLEVTHQGRDSDAGAMRAAYAAAGITPRIAAYFPDLPAEMAASHIVIARSGASTVAELAVMGRPAILVPLPIATDDHQYDNAAGLAAAGGAIVIRQPDFVAVRLAAALTGWLSDPKALASAAAGARGLGRPDAAERLADLVIASGSPS